MLENIVMVVQKEKHIATSPNIDMGDILFLGSFNYSFVKQLIAILVIEFDSLAIHK